MTSCAITFYRAMHFSAKRGIEIACRLSVRPSVFLSVTLVDQEWISNLSDFQFPHRLEILETNCTINLPSLFVAQRPSTNSQGNMGQFGGE